MIFFFLNPPLNEKDGKYQSQLSHLQTQLILSSCFSEEDSSCFCSIRDHLYDEDMVLPGPPNYIPSVFMPYLWEQSQDTQLEDKNNSF